ncbi:MAG TPA: 4Fe-4S dicluster domain-containing protein [Clostridia bacterium]|nr:4Fe-4S dicluster domain-containing protein [Clostridia bacterium]
MLNDTSMQPSILICECVHTAHIGEIKSQAIRASLNAAGISYTAVPDLCELATRKDPRLKEFAGARNIRILACYPRTVRALFHFAGAPIESQNAEVLNVRELSAEAAVSQLGIALAPAELGSQSAPEPKKTDWIPWFPVLDYERCSNCQQCLGFCLFGVYALSAEGKVTVENPQACKTNCPACARICPEVAIIFPKYESGAIAGAEITDESLEKSRAQADLQKLLGSNVYGTLAERREKARSRRLLRKDFAQAHDERKAFLQKSGLENPEVPPRTSGSQSSDSIAPTP